MPKPPVSIARSITKFSKKEITQLFDHARPVYHDASFNMSLARAAGAHGRALIITPRRMGTAPERNRIKRQLKALFYQEKLYLLPYDWIISCKKKSSSLSFSTIKQILLSIATAHTK